MAIVKFLLLLERKFFDYFNNYIKRGKIKETFRRMLLNLWKFSIDTTETF